MKIKVINRSLEEHLPSSSNATAPVSRNLDPALHPFARSREYTRAVVASKIDRMFSKPFVAALEGHGDGVYSMAKDEMGGLSRVASGSGDGELKLWDLGQREWTWDTANAHKGMVRGVAFSHFGGPGQDGIVAAVNNPGRGIKRKRVAPHGGKGKGKALEDDSDDEEYGGGVARGSSRLLSCGVDKTVKLWDIRDETRGNQRQPLQTYHGKSGFYSISHHRHEPMFATASATLDIWDLQRTTPVQTLKFHSSSSNMSSGENIESVAFNKSETSVLASSGSDRTVCLYDMRSGKAVGRVIMNMRVNNLVFNPMQPPVLLCASEDHQLYTYDIRNLKTTTQVYKGHVGAVMSCDWAPTGREFVSGGYDRTVRLWNTGDGKGRDTYHTKRMQRVFSVSYTLDSRFVLSGSDDSNLRIWKARASDKLGALDRREQSRREYRDTLREKWGDVGEVAKLERQRFLPKAIHNAEVLRREMLASRARKEENRRVHAPAGERDVKPKPERTKAIIRTEI